MGKTKYKEMERIIIDKESIDDLEEDIIIRRGLERYMYVRQFAYGRVLDIASGVGYGSYLLSKNPDVINVTAVDKSEKAIEQAESNFKNDKIKFILGEPKYVKNEFDILVCLETIEHLDHPEILNEMVERCNIKEVIISFPNKKTTHYNKYHMWDVTEEDVLRVFKNFQCYKIKNMNDSTIMNLVKIERNSSPFKKYRY